MDESFKCKKCGNEFEKVLGVCPYCGDIVKVEKTNVDVPTENEPAYVSQAQCIKHCTNCGAEMPTDANFCTSCGSKNLYRSTNRQCIRNGKNKGKKPKMVFAFLAIFIAICIALTALIKIISNDENATLTGGDFGMEENATLTAAKKTKTVMIYMVGSDLESKSGAASVDIAEIINSGIDTEKHNVLVYTGGAAAWQNNIPVDKNCIFKLEDGGMSAVKEYDSLNMGQSETLTDFIKYSTENYKTDEYGLILWNHGAGPMIGYGVDEIHGDLLELSEITKALGDSGFGSDKKLEFLGFDACLMGSVETAWAVKDYADFLIASQETEPGTGWNYDFLEMLNYYDEGNYIGKAIIDYYFSDYEEKVLLYPQLEADLTLSCMELSKINSVEECINELFEKVDTNILSGSFQQTSKCRYETKSFGKFSSDVNYDLIDLTHITSLLSSEYKKESENLNKALKEFIVYSKSNVENASGVSIYHPYDNTEYMKTWINTFNSFGFASEYSKYISNFCSILTGKTLTSYDNFNESVGTSKKNKEGNEISIKLTEEQRKNYVGSKYYIVKKMENDEYLFVFSGVDAKLDKNGVLSASYNEKAVFGIDDSNGEISELPIIMYQVNDSGNELKYFAPSMFFDYKSENISEWDVKAVKWQIKIDDGVPKLLSAISLDDEDDDNLVPSKQLLNYKDYSYVQFVFSSRKPTYDNSGKLLPYFEWESAGTFYGTEYDVEKGFHLECRDIENKDEYYAMFVIDDAQGNKYTSELFALDK